MAIADLFIDNDDCSEPFSVHKTTLYLSIYLMSPMLKDICLFLKVSWNFFLISISFRFELESLSLSLLQI